MATVRPFRALRFSAADLAPLVAPPYDVISPEERAELAGQSEHNVVHITLPEQLDDDRSKFVKYARSASRLQAWADTGVMAAEDQPTYYRYTQKFDLPSGERLSRTALIALIKVEPYEKGVVLPHEQTFPKHKEDRLRILEATNAHLECIFGLFEDPGSAILNDIEGAPAKPMSRVTTDDGIEHIIEGIQDPEIVSRIGQAMESRKVWIADGHHRYETAMTFRQNMGEKPGEIAQDFMMMALSSIADPGLVLLPTHRILNRAPEDLVARLKAGPWEVESCPNGDLMKRIEAYHTETRRAFGVALPGGEGLILKISDVNKVAESIPMEASNYLKTLDVTVLHEVVFAQCLGLTGNDFFGYTRIEQEALDAVENGAPASFLQNPPTVDDMRHVSMGGEKMPQKSTYYYPKILSGLVLWRFADF